MTSREDILNMVRYVNPRSYIADNFGKYAKPYHLTRLIARYELFKMILGVHGAVIECGLRSGSGLIEWMHLSRMLEPLGRLRCAFGFDTFGGFPNVGKHDGDAKKGDQADPCDDDLIRCIHMHAANNIIVAHDYSTCDADELKGFGNAHPWPQIGFMKGDFMETGDVFLKSCPHLIVALLFLDFDLYGPTKKAIELFLPRMPRGSVIVFDELNHFAWPGETLALMETIGIRNLELKRFPWEMSLSYAVLP